MTDLKQETTKNLVGIFSFIALLVITMVLFKMNQTQTTQKQSANIVAINSNAQVANNVIAQNQKNIAMKQTQRNEFSNLLNGTPEQFQKAGEIVMMVMKDSISSSEKKWYKDEYLKEENSKKLYQNLIEANKKLELEFGLNSKEFKERQLEVAKSMGKIKEYKIFLKVTERFNELQKVPLN